MIKIIVSNCSNSTLTVEEPKNKQLNRQIFMKFVVLLGLGPRNKHYTFWRYMELVLVLVHKECIDCGRCTCWNMSWPMKQTLQFRQRSGPDLGPDPGIFQLILHKVTIFKFGSFSSVNFGWFSYSGSGSICRFWQRVNPFIFGSNLNHTQNIIQICSQLF